MGNNIQVALFGAGNVARMFLRQCKNIDVIAAFDNDSEKWGNEFEQVCILPPYKLDDIECEHIVVTTAYHEISRQIEEQYPHLKEKICSVDIMLDLQYVHTQYMKRYCEKPESVYSMAGKKMVVYTGIFGKYDDLHEPLVTEPDVDYVCFTDDAELKSEKWKIRYVECEHDNMAIEVRKYKCLPHRFFKEYDISFWVDAGGQLIAPLKPLIEKYMGLSGILVFPHYQRDCIYEEGAANIIQHRENTANIINQMYQYNAAGFPEHYGLFCGGYIVREHNREEILKCMEEWYKEVLDKSARDQISLPYVLNKNEIHPDLIDEHVVHNKWFGPYMHRQRSE